LLPELPIGADGRQANGDRSDRQQEGEQRDAGLGGQNLAGNGVCDQHERDQADPNAVANTSLEAAGLPPISATRS
jgi:hypothetical protein